MSLGGREDVVGGDMAGSMPNGAIAKKHAFSGVSQIDLFLDCFQYFLQ